MRWIKGAMLAVLCFGWGASGLAQESRFLMPGQLRVVFKRIDARLAQNRLARIGLRLPDGGLRAESTLLATPHRNQAKFYERVLLKDSTVKSVDTTFTDDHLKPYGEHIEADTAYLWVTFSKPQSLHEETKWLKERHPELIDVLRNNRNFRVAVANDKTGERTYGMRTNPWYGENFVQTISVPSGKEDTYIEKIKRLNIAERIEKITDCAPRGSCRDNNSHCPPGTVCSGMPAFGCYPIGCPYPVCLSSNTKIATPTGEMRITNLREGMGVWTFDHNGQRVAAPILRLSKAIATASHQMVHLLLADGRELWASPGHPLADGRLLGELEKGDIVDGSLVQKTERLNDWESKTYDLLPDGDTGAYWANGIPLASTLKPKTRNPIK